MSLELRGMHPFKKDRLPSVGDHIHVTPTFEHAWATLTRSVIEI